ncbi:competence protein CoiA family protein [Pullulanibacillus sp. KACC 23026]|uniref:competence protein CoiA n=1 Tax=Pullulanibacillus sp. KACC 23026 TaxID=3028315 RepID=UPI0023B1735D|nr:competence protein CoiA family protein [Pullulanibacillus sp. KACC 23026]WEG11916.1 competence protein CoiA family protein [Pullulanibacillus sp. KACC 23026]
MLVALWKDGTPFSLAEPHEYSWLLKQREEQTFLCPICHSPLLMKLGMKKCYHFAHKRESDCLSHSEPETPAHIQGKKDLYEWLKKQELSPKLEWYFPEINQRADVGLTCFPQSLAFEFQCSTIPIEKLLERDKGYRNRDMQPIWIWHKKRLRQLSTHTFQLTPLEWSTLRFPFIHPPLTLRQQQKGFLIFYEPSSQYVTFLYHLIPLNSRRVMAEKVTRPLGSLSLQDLLKPFLLPKQHSLLANWMMVKKKWRVGYVAYSQVFEYELQRVASNKAVVWKAFPGVVGLPTGDFACIETPCYQWQGWICLIFLFGYSEGTLIEWETVRYKFSQLINRRWIRVQIRCETLNNWETVVLSYLQALCTLGYLRLESKGAYVIEKKLEWPEPFLDELMKEDQHMLEFWLSKEKG